MNVLSDFIGSNCFKNPIFTMNTFKSILNLSLVIASLVTFLALMSWLEYSVDFDAMVGLNRLSSRETERSPDLIRSSKLKMNSDAGIALEAGASPEGNPKETSVMNKPSIEEVKAASEKDLMAIPGVMGVGISLNRDRQPCIKVYVDRQSASTVDQIPQIIEGYPVEVEVRGTFRAQ